MSTPKWYKVRRKSFKCVSCGKQDERTLLGKAYCSECYAKQEEQREKRCADEEYVRRAREERLEWEELMQDNGRCKRCGRPMEEGATGVNCIACRVYFRERRRKSAKQEIARPDGYEWWR